MAHLPFQNPLPALFSLHPLSTVISRHLVKARAGRTKAMTYFDVKLLTARSF